MMTYYKDISGKIEEPVVEAIALLTQVSKSVDVRFVLIGASARDMIFSSMFNIKTTRATLDVDFVVRLKDWDEFESLKEALIQTKEFVESNKYPHRLLHKSNTILDIIPYGEIENPKGSIRWPDDGNIMSTIGIEEVFNSAIQVQICSKPELVIPVATPAGLVILKLISWNEQYPIRKKDAEDIYFIMKNYIEAGNTNRLYESDADLAQVTDFDYELVNPRLLGRDISAIASSGTSNTIIAILNEEIAESSQYRLIRDMMSRNQFEKDGFEKTLTLLQQLKLGIMERQVNH